MGRPELCYNIRYRYGGKETRKQQGEVFGCIPHGARAYLECTSLPWGLTPL